MSFCSLQNIRSFFVDGLIDALIINPPRPSLAYMMKIVTLMLLLLTLETNAEDLAKRFKELYVEGTYSIDSRNRDYNPSGISEFGIQRPGGFCNKDGDLNPCTYSFVVKANGTVSYQRIYPPSEEHHGHINNRYLTRLLDLIDESDFFGSIRVSQSIFTENGA